MRFDLNMIGTTIEIIPTSEGRYATFEDVRDEIIRREQTLIINQIIVIDGGAKIPVQNGLSKIKAGVSLEDLITAHDRAEVEKLFNIAQEKKIQSKNEIEVQVERAKSTGDWGGISEDIINDLVSDIILTTSMFVANHDIEQELEVITAECAYGMNVFRDLFAAVRDVVGGRSKATEKVLHDARDAALSELRMKAFQVGADAVIAVDLEYVELSGGGKNGMLLIVATGTAVKLKNKLN